MRRLAAAGVVGIVGMVVVVLFGWLRAKGLAVALGPEGIGLYGQVWTLVLYAGGLASLGIGVGTAALVAAERERGATENLATICWISVALPLLVGLGLLALTVAGAGVIAPTLLGHRDFLLMLLAAVSIPLVAVQAPLGHVLHGLEDAVGQSTTFALYAIGFTAFSVAGAFAYDVDGAVAALALGNALLAGLYLARSATLLGRLGARLRVRSIATLWQSPITRKLLRIGAAALAVTVVATGAELAVRTILLNEEGAQTAGIWFGLTLISVQFIGGAAGALSYLTAPIAARAATRGDTAAVGKVLDDSWRLGLIGLLPVLAVISVMREPVVSILFTGEFSEMSGYLPAQTAGDALRSQAWMLGVAFVPLGYTRAWMVIGVGVSAVFAAFGGFAAAEWGLGGAVGGWTLMWALSLLGTVAVLVSRGAWRPSRRSVAGTPLGALLLGAAAILPGAYGLVVVGVLSALLAVVVTTTQERAAVAAGIRSRLRTQPG